MAFDLDGYKDVPQRIADFKALHPDGCLRPVNEAEPYRIEAIDGRYFIVYVAAAYRGPDDKLPGIGTAWEPFPGKTPYTKDSELQNAETSAWGRAIVAALRSESKAIASAEDVRNRRADQDATVQPVERLVTPEGELIEVWPGELSAKSAKGKLLEAFGGIKHDAETAWTAAGLDGKLKVTDAELGKALQLVPKAAEGADDEPPKLPNGEAQTQAFADATEALTPKGAKP